MGEAPSDPRLVRLSELVAERLGLNFPPERSRNLARGLREAARELGFRDFEAALEELLASTWDRHRFEVLACHLTVGETYFFREPAVVRALAGEVLPALIAARRGGERRLRVWSAGCASGEEPYTVAMLLDGLLGEREGWTITILATDINVKALRKGETGVYSAWSLRETPQAMRERYFGAKDGNHFEVLPRIREMVEFAPHNLAGDPLPSLANGTNAMDLILCRNVLMYFHPKLARAVVDRFHVCLVDGGWLSVSACEASRTLFAQFETVELAGAWFYRRLDAAHRPPTTIPGPSVAQAIAVIPRSEATRDLGGGAVGDASPAQTPQDYAPRSDRSLGSREGAQGASGGACAAGPPPPPHERAVRLLADHRLAEARELLVAGLAAGDDPRVLASLARLAADQGRLDEAREWCERAITADTLDAGCHHLLATILQEQGESERAVEELRRALFLDQGFVLAHFALGNLARGGGGRKGGRHAEPPPHFQNVLATLADRAEDEVLPDAEGMTAGRLAELVRGLLPAAEGDRTTKPAPRRATSRAPRRPRWPPHGLWGATAGPRGNSRARGRGR